MATINYKEKYEQALERARQFMETPYLENSDDVVGFIFPELAESEDERIRKVLLNDFKNNCSEYYCEGVNRDMIIAWLEKQGKITKEWSEMKINNIQTELQEMVDLKQKTEQDEQNPTDKIEPKFHEGDIIIHKELGGDYIHNSHKIIQVDILDKKYRLEGGLVAHFGEQDDYELVEQNHAWSKDDEKQLQYAIAMIKWYTGGLDIITWLISLKDRVLPQPKQEWSDFDKDILFRTIDSLKFLKDTISKDPKYAVNIIDIEREISWLKSLRPQNTWKPSERQKEALLWCVVHLGGADKQTLGELLEALNLL